MGCRFCLALMLATAAALVLPRDASADQYWKTNSAIWKLRDNCTVQAQKTYPDYTPESNAKREKARKNCLLGNNLPAEESSLPPASPAPNAPQQ
jgi:hypothetical protein